EGQALWRTDGTAAGTKLVKQTNTQGVAGNDYGGGPGDSLLTAPRQLTVVGTRLFFAASDGTHGDEVWVSDGTAAGTRMVKDLNTTPPMFGPGQTLGSVPSELTAMGGKLYFTTAELDGGRRELWG